MFKNYLKIAIRNLIRHKVNSFINITGLAIGIACCILIFLYALNELSYDRFHKHADNIFRVLTIDENLGVSSNLVGITMPPLGPAMVKQIPEVVESVRMTGARKNLLEYEEKTLYAEKVVYTEPSLFSTFDFELLSGDPQTALNRPNTAVITEEMTQKIFGSDNPIGKTVTLDDQDEIEIIGIVVDVKQNSHLEFDMLVSLYPTEQDTNFVQFLESWQNIAMVTYVRLGNPKAETDVETKMEALIRETETGEGFHVTLQPLIDAHLRSPDVLFDAQNRNKGDINSIYSMITVALFVILIASFNFMNLSTARSANRAREVGMRKTVGALRTQLIYQFLGESTFLCFLALGLALVLVEIFGPMLNLAIEGSIIIYLFSDISRFGLLILMTLMLGVFAGSYPAHVLSSFRPVKVLKGTFKGSSSGIWLRRVLVVAQFTVSVAMIIGLAIVYQQLDYTKNKKLGFDKGQVLNIYLGRELTDRFEPLKNELAQLPSISAIATSSSMPGRGFGRRGMVPEGAADDENWIVSVMSIDENYIDMMDMKIIEGRNFSPEFTTDADQAVLINQTAAKELGWQSSIGKKIKFGRAEDGPESKIIGVIEDFHFASMRHKIEPLFLNYRPGVNFVLSLSLEPGDIPATVASITKIWQEVIPSHPFEYSFFDQDFDRLYRSDENFADLLLKFTWLAIFIACLGLFGLAAFTTEQRTKEIGIRKVLGASISNLVMLLSKEFLKLVLIAVIFAFPLAYLSMDKWLQHFAYRIDIGLITFVLAGVLALAIALATVSFQAIKAAVSDPVDALKYE